MRSHARETPAAAMIAPLKQMFRSHRSRPIAEVIVRINPILRGWETYTVPTDAPQPGNEKMQAQARTTWGNANGVPITGGGTWTTTTLDPDRGLLYVPVGNPG